MRISENVLLEDVVNQSSHKWVVITALDAEGGGSVYALAQSVEEADAAAAELWARGEDGIVLEGLSEGIILEGVFVS